MAATSCAKFPDNPTGNNTRLIVTMRVAGHIKNGPTEQGAQYAYFVAFNPSTQLFPTSNGPIPVIAPPWGNGFVAGGATHFVRYDYVQQSPYLVYKFNAADLVAFGPTGVPLIYDVPDANGAILRFEIDLSQITPNGVNPGDLQSVQVNFLTMNRIPQGNDAVTKIWDALGNSASPSSVNDYVRIPLNISRIYTNADFQDLEPTNDTPDPDLDIIDWSVEVRRP